MPIPEITRRTLLLAGLSSIGLGGLALQLSRLTLGGQKRWEETLADETTQEVILSAQRGRILDARGRELATNRPAYAAYIRYPDYKDEQSLRQVCTLLGVDPAPVLATARAVQSQDRYWLPVLVKDDLSDLEITRIVERRQKFGHLAVQPHPVRLYPYGPLAAHVVGYTARPNQKEIEAGIDPNERVGRFGLEAHFDALLRGQKGKKLVHTRSNNIPTGKEDLDQKAVPGQDLHLTLDLQLQHIAEQALERTLAHIRATHNPDGHTYKHAQSGALVAMDPNTGAVLALASVPGFDPNWFITGDDRLGDLFQDTRAPFVARAWQGTYNPGSTWKAITSVAALLQGAISPRETVYCTGVYDRFQPPIHCWSVHGHINVQQALAGSCDVFFYEMGYRLGVEPIVQMAGRFGIGVPTGIDLPDEAIGWLPTKENLAKLAADGHEWNQGETLFAAIGQKVTTTPLAIARYACALANGGKLLRPQLVRPSSGGVVADQVRPEVVHELQVDPGLLATVRTGLRWVTEEGGTAAGRFKALGIPVAGKTGTAEVGGQDPYGVFIAYAPADAPRVAVAVVGEQAGHGDSMIPAVKAVIAAALGKRLPPEDEGYLPEVALPEPL